jgi:hypothetical protein
MSSPSEKGGFSVRDQKSILEDARSARVSKISKIFHNKSLEGRSRSNDRSNAKIKEPATNEPTSTEAKHGLKIASEEGTGT